MSFVGKYEIREKLGSGATADVFHAYDSALGREVAIKILKPALVADADSFQRFMLEARSAASLFHPNIITVLDMGEMDGRYYIAMRYVNGSSLDKILEKQGALSFEDVCKLATQIGSALNHAHQQGFLHRDVKPSNILRDMDGDYFLSDFGLTKAMMSTGLSSHTGAILGTPPYIPPEIWSGEKASPSSDQYALACVLYEALTGKVLFDGDTPPAVMTAHVLRDPDLSIAPPIIQPVLKKALAKKPEARYSDINAFAAALNANTENDEDTDFYSPQSEVATIFDVAQQRKTKPIESSRIKEKKGWLVWAVGGGVGLALLAGVIMIFSTLVGYIGQTISPTAVRSTAVTINLLPTNQPLNTPLAPTIYTQSATETTATLTWVIAASATQTTSPQPILIPDGSVSPNSSQTSEEAILSERIAFLSGSNPISLNSIRPDGSAREKVAESLDSASKFPQDHWYSPHPSRLLDLSWSPDGKWLAWYGSDIKSGLINIKDSRNSPEIAGLADANFISWSPDGKQNAFSIAGEIYLRNIADTNQVNLTKNVDPTNSRYHCWGPVWSPSGKTILYVCMWDITPSLDECWYCPEAIYYLKEIDPQHPEKSKKLLSKKGEIFFNHDGWSPDGSSLVYTTSANAIWKYDFRTEANIRLVTGVDPAWSPDGETIVFRSLELGAHNLSLMNPDGTNIKPISNTDDKDWGPVWSPDSQRIAFVSSRDGNQEIYTMNADGSNLENLTNSQEDEYAPAWSP